METAQTSLVTENKYGIDQLELVIELMPLCIPQEVNKQTLDKSLDSFKRFLFSKINREMTRQEYVNFLHGLADYTMSDAQSNKRRESMNYLFGLKFLD